MTAAMHNQRHETGRATVDGQPAPQPQHLRRWRALWVSLFAAFMTLLDTSIVNVALPSIERDLGAAAASVQWVVSGYALAFGLTLVPAGRLGDALGRRRMFLFALSAFVTTTAPTPTTPTFTVPPPSRHRHRNLGRTRPEPQPPPTDGG